MGVYDKMDNDQRLRWFRRLATAFRVEVDTPDHRDLQYRKIMDINLPHIRHLIVRLVAFNQNAMPAFTEDLDGLLRLVVRYLTYYTILFGTEELAKLSLSVSE